MGARGAALLQKTVAEVERGRCRPVLDAAFRAWRERAAAPRDIAAAIALICQQLQPRGILYGREDERRLVLAIFDAARKSPHFSVEALWHPALPRVGAAVFPVYLQNGATGGALRTLVVDPTCSPDDDPTEQRFQEALSAARAWVGRRVPALGRALAEVGVRVEPEVAGGALEDASVGLAAVMAFASWASGSPLPPEIAFSGVIDPSGRVDRVETPNADTLAAKLAAVRDELPGGTLHLPGGGAIGVCADATNLNHLVKTLLDGWEEFVRRTAHAHVAVQPAQALGVVDRRLLAVLYSSSAPLSIATLERLIHDRSAWPALQRSCSVHAHLRRLGAHPEAGLELPRVVCGANGRWTVDPESRPGRHPLAERVDYSVLQAADVAVGRSLLDARPAAALRHACRAERDDLAVEWAPRALEAGLHETFEALRAVERDDDSIPAALVSCLDETPAGRLVLLALTVSRLPAPLAIHAEALVTREDEVDRIMALQAFAEAALHTAVALVMALAAGGRIRLDLIERRRDGRSALDETLERLRERPSIGGLKSLLVQAEACVAQHSLTAGRWVTALAECLGAVAPAAKRVSKRLGNALHCSLVWQRFFSPDYVADLEPLVFDLGGALCEIATGLRAWFGEHRLIWRGPGHADGLVLDAETSVEARGGGYFVRLDPHQPLLPLAPWMVPRPDAPPTHAAYLRGQLGGVARAWSFDADIELRGRAGGAPESPPVWRVHAPGHLSTDTDLEALLKTLPTPLAIAGQALFKGTGGRPGAWLMALERSVALALRMSLYTALAAWFAARAEVDEGTLHVDIKPATKRNLLSTTRGLLDSPPDLADHPAVAAALRQLERLANPWLDEVVLQLERWEHHPGPVRGWSRRLASITALWVELLAEARWGEQRWSCLGVPLVGRNPDRFEPGGITVELEGARIDLGPWVVAAPNGSGTRGVALVAVPPDIRAYESALATRIGRKKKGVGVLYVTPGFSPLQAPEHWKARWIADPDAPLGVGLAKLESADWAHVG